MVIQAKIPVYHILSLLGFLAPVFWVFVAGLELIILAFILYGNSDTRKAALGFNLSFDQVPSSFFILRIFIRILFLLWGWCINPWLALLILPTFIYITSSFSTSQ